MSKTTYRTILGGIAVAEAANYVWAAAAHMSLGVLLFDIACFGFCATLAIIALDDA